MFRTVLKETYSPEENSVYETIDQSNNSRSLIVGKGKFFLNIKMRTIRPWVSIVVPLHWQYSSTASHILLINFFFVFFFYVLMQRRNITIGG